MFGAGELAAVVLVSSGLNLSEPPPGTDWATERSFTCGTRDPGPPEVTPEPIVRGVLAQGYSLWRRSHPPRVKGASQ